MRKRSSLSNNDDFLLNGIKYRVISIDHPNVTIQQLEGDMKGSEVNYYKLVTEKGFVLNHQLKSAELNDEEEGNGKVIYSLLDSLSDERQLKISRKYEVIKPILLLDKVKTKDVKSSILFYQLYNDDYLNGGELNVSKLTQKELIEKIAKKFKTSPRTIERDLSNYRKEEREFNAQGKNALISQKIRNPHQRKDLRLLQICHPKKRDLILSTIHTYLNEDYCKILKEVIEHDYLTKRQPSIKEIHDIIEIRCGRAKPKLDALGYDTVYGIIKRLDEEKILRLRNGSAAAQAYDPITGNFSNTEAMSSLHIVEIDHTELDLIVLDEKSMEVLGRPWITLGIDVYSRCVWCLHISFDNPSGDKVRKAIEHGVLYKQVKEKYQTRNEWEVQGIPDIIYFDNGTEFDNAQIKKLIDETLESQVMYRPVANPRWGGTIERLFGTINSELIHRLAGTTKSSVKDKGEYDSTKNAIFTLKDVTELLTRYIADIYHHDIHEGILSTPYSRYQEGLNKGGQNDIILPIPEEEEPFKIMLLPHEELSFGRLGIRMDNVYYNLNSLKRLIRNDNSKKYRVKYDIDDISKVYVLDPDLQEYFEVPAVNPGAELLRGIKKKTYKLLVKIIREKGKLKGQNVPDADDLLAAKDDLYERISQMIKTNKGKIRAINHGYDIPAKNEPAKINKPVILNEDDELLLLVADLNYQLV